MVMITCARPSSGLIVRARGGIPNLVGRFGGAFHASSTLNAAQVREFWVRVMYVWGGLARLTLAVLCEFRAGTHMNFGLGLFMCKENAIYIYIYMMCRMFGVNGCGVVC